MSKNATKMNGISPTNVKIFGKIDWALSVRSKKYEKHVAHNIPGGA